MNFQIADQSIYLMTLEIENLKKDKLKLLNLLERYERIKDLLLPIINECKCNNMVKKNNIKKLEELLDEYNSKKGNLKSPNEFESIKIQEEKKDKTINDLSNNKINYNEDEQTNDDIHLNDLIEIDLNEYEQQQQDYNEDCDNKIFGDDSNHSDNKSSNNNVKIKKSKKQNKNKPSSSKLYFCTWPNCKNTYTNNKSLWSHLKRHKNKDKFKCNKCDKAFYDEYKLKCHMRIHLSDLFKCDWPGCEFKTNYAYNIKRHKLTHVKNSNELTEEIQNGITNDLSNNLIQTDFIEQKQDYNGEYDNEISDDDSNHSDYKSSNDKLVKIKNSKKQKQNKPLSSRVYCCTWNNCERTYTNRKSFKQHLKRHKNKDKFKCDKCDKAFYDKHKLKEHMRTHSNKPLRCDWPGCEFKTTYAYNIKRHKLSHMKNK